MSPASETELADLLRGAQEPFHIVGGGTRGIGGSVVGDPLETARLSGITLYEPGALTLVVAAGTPIADVEAALAAEGQRLPFEIPDLRGLMRRDGQSTIGGVAATNASGPRRIQAGACRDSMIGVRFVDGTGTVVKNGGRVMKNVTGYDLVKLLAGSHGTLGVLTEVAFKLLPVPETSATLVLPGLDLTRAVAAMAAAIGSPFEVTGAAHWPGEGTFLRIEGFAASVAYRAGQLSRLLASFAEAGIEDHVAGAARWAQIRDVMPFHDRSGDVWKLSVTPSAAPGIAARLEAEALLFDWGGGLIWALMAKGVDLRAKFGAFPGHATLVRANAEGSAAISTFQPEVPALAAITAGLRARFDPKGLLNPGLMG
ncbi:MAG: 2-hydroxy-acid oxidase [Cereibacter sphaeroides]|uniref:2-hydroxy-acid oxidase n=1 Tax=Cereibacter sphaeroides TaxID=1063 RepID=A0A2W5UGS9_CERSP|nr:MAG: 2-hydroxy-acid oxidase [Cereibacter sphaeroides]